MTRALTCFGEREPTEPWSWHGTARSVTGRTWGGCIEVIEWILTARRFPCDPQVLDGGVLIIEASNELLPARNVGWIVRSPGERGILAAVDAVLVARPPTSDFERRPPAEERARLRAEQRDVVVDLVGRYNPDAVVCAGIPFGHTRPQWIVPHGVLVTVDGAGAAGLLPITHSRAGPPGAQRGLAGSPGRSRITASAAATTATAGAIRAICQPVMSPTTMDGADGEPPPMGRAGRANAAGTAMVEASSAAVRMARAPATRWMGGDGGWVS